MTFRNTSGNGVGFYVGDEGKSKVVCIVLVVEIINFFVVVWGWYFYDAEGAGVRNEGDDSVVSVVGRMIVVLVVMVE